VCQEVMRRFQSLKERRQFLEHARVFGQDYGTRRAAVEGGIKKGATVVLTIDVRGARSVRRLLRGKVPLLTIFVLPPSITVLRERLEKRSTDSPDEIDHRIEKAEDEVKAAKEYDGTVINRDLAQTVRDIETLVKEFEKKLQTRREK